MKTFFLLFLYLGLLASSLQAFSTGMESLDGLTRERLKEGEIISTVELVPGTKTHRCEVMGIIRAPKDNVWDVISDYNRYSQFMPLTPVAFLVNPEAQNLWQGQSSTNWNRFEKELMKHKLDVAGKNPLYFYNRFKMPWPLKDRQFVLKTEKFPEIYTSRWVEVFGNTRVNKGSWVLVSFEGRKDVTLAIYTLYVDLGISIPVKIIQSGMKGLPEIIRSLRQRISGINLDDFLTNL